MKHILIVLILLLSVSSMAVKDEELQKYKEKYKDENAVILEHNQIVSISINKKTGELDLYRTDYEEVLYLNESSKFYTTRSISISEYFQDITSISVTVIKPDGKKIKLKDEDFKTVDSNPTSWVFHDDDKELTFSLRELGEGYKTIIEYTKKLKKPEFFGVFQFMSMYPVESQLVSITHPKEVGLLFTEMNFNSYNITKNSETIKESIVDKWVAKEVSAFSFEDGSLGASYFLPKVVARIKSYQSNGKTVNVMSSVDDLHTFFEEFLLSKDDEKDRGEINRIVREITDGMDSELEKMDTIFKWVQNNIKYIAFEDGANGFVPRACSKVMKDRYGDCKDMGNLLVEMLTYAKVKNAHVAWVGTRKIPYQMSEIPSPLTTNHVICVVDKPEGGYYYLDATGSEVSYLIPPVAIQSKELLIHYGEGEYKLVKVIPVEGVINSYISEIFIEVNDKDSIVGRGKDAYKGYQRERITYRLKNYEKDDLDDFMKGICVNGYNKYTLKSYSIDNLYDNNIELFINYDFTFENTLIKDGDDYYFNPDLFDLGGIYYSPEEYKQSRKKSFYRDNTYLYHVKISDDFDVKHLPEKIEFNNDLIHFITTFEQNGNEILVKKQYSYNMLEVKPSYFEEWNAFSRALNLAAMQNIILTKKK